MYSTAAGRGRRILRFGWDVRPGRSGSRPEVAVWILIAVMLAAAAIAVPTALGIKARSNPTFSALDEEAHFDYVVRLSEGHVVRWGDLYTPQTVHILDCLGQARLHPEPCTDNTDPTVFTPKGFSYEAQQSPLAYLAYLPFLTRSGSALHQLAMVRRGGLVWLWIGTALLLAVAWLGRMSLIQTAAVLAICNLNPLTIHSTTVVTNDSAGVAAGAASIVVLQIGRRYPTRWLVAAALLVGVIVGLLKGLYLVAPLALLVGGLLTERHLPRRATLGEFWRRRRCETALFAGALVSYVGFLIIQGLREATPSAVVLHDLLGGYTTRDIRWSTLEQSVQNSFILFVEGSQPLYYLWNLLVYGTLLGLLLHPQAPRRRSLSALAAGTVLGLVAVTVSVTVVDFLQGHYDYYGPTRYALPMLPLLGYLVARSSRPTAVAVTGVAVPVLATYAQHFGHPF